MLILFYVLFIVDLKTLQLKMSSLAVEIKPKYLWIQFLNIWQRNKSEPIDAVLKL